jgi:hypothetical protein
MLVPAGKEMRVSVRFSCPSAVKNLGRPVKEQADTIRRYARQLVPPNARPPEPPPLRPGERVDWPRLLDIVAVLERLIAGGSTELPQRLIRALVFTRREENGTGLIIDGGRRCR